MEVSVDRNQKDAKPQDCLSCKVLSSSALIIASLYVISIGMKARLRRTRIVSAAFATSNCVLPYLQNFMRWN